MPQPKYFRDYLGLVAGLSLLLVLFIAFDYLRQFQSILLFSAAFYYVGWGIVHHYLRGELHSKIVLEYLAVSAFALILALTVLSRT